MEGTSEGGRKTERGRGREGERGLVVFACLYVGKRQRKGRECEKEINRTENSEGGRGGGGERKRVLSLVLAGANTNRLSKDGATDSQLFDFDCTLHMAGQNVLICLKINLSFVSLSSSQ